MTTKNFLNRFSWIMLVVLLVPAGAAQASQNAVPGDSIYPVKLVLEDALLLVMKPSNSVTSDLEIKFTKRRLLEVEQVVDTPFVIKSLRSLNEQVADTTESIQKVKNLDKQSELVDEYIQILQETQVSLDQQKIVVANSTVVNQVNSYTYTTSQVVNNNYYYNSSSENNNAAQAEIQRQLEETQAEIAAEIERLRQVALENERIRQEQAEAALEAERQRQADEAAAVVRAAQQEQEVVEAAAQAAQQEQAQEDDDQSNNRDRSNRSNNSGHDRDNDD